MVRGGGRREVSGLLQTSDTEKTPTRGSGRHPNPIPLPSPRTGAMGRATRRMRSLSARKTRISHRCASPKSTRRVASPLGARVRVSTAGSDAAQGVGLSPSLDKKISRSLGDWEVALTLDGGVDLGGLHGRGDGHLLKLRSELAGGELALGAGEHLSRGGGTGHGR